MTSNLDAGAFNITSINQLSNTPTDLTSSNGAFQRIASAGSFQIRGADMTTDADVKLLYIQAISTLNRNELILDSEDFSIFSTLISFALFNCCLVSEFLFCVSCCIVANCLFIDPCNSDNCFIVVALRVSKVDNDISSDLSTDHACPSHSLLQPL